MHMTFAVAVNDNDLRIIEIIRTFTFEILEECNNWIAVPVIFCHFKIVKVCFFFYILRSIIYSESKVALCQNSEFVLISINKLIVNISSYDIGVNINLDMTFVSYQFVF